MRSPAPVLAGEILANKYRVERTIGQGGMGVVVAAEHIDLGQRVAIKFILGDVAGPATERFIREAKATALIKSEHVCRVQDFGRLETGEPYIVMEYLEGIDLSQKLEREGRQPIEDVAGWIVEACDALSEAHALGVVHRDLKPANMFLAKRPDGSTTVKVLDFGISKLPQANAMTGSAVMMGSPLYMSPEQIESSRDVDVRSDVWSLGIVLYELLTGTQPFISESMIQLAMLAREKMPEPMTALRPEISGELEAIVFKCLAKQPSHRFQSVSALAVALSPFAPADVQAIASRLARREQGRPSDPSLVATQREPSSSGGTPPAKSVTPATTPTQIAPAKSGPVQGTLDGLQTNDRRDRRARSRMLLAGVGAIALAAASFGVMRTRGVLPASSASAGLVSTPSTSASAPSSEPSHRLAPIEDVVASAPPAMASAAASTPLTAPSTSVVPTRVTPGGRPSGARTAPSVAPAIALSTTETSPIAVPATSARKKRELDRDYER